MTARRGSRLWLGSGALVLAAHGAVLAVLMMAGVRLPVLPEPEPVVLIELPPLAAPAPQPQQAEAVTQPQPEPAQPQSIAPRVTAPTVNAPLPREVVSVPPQPQPSRAAAPAQPQPAPQPAAPQAASPSEVQGDSPSAVQQEADYKSLVIGFVRRSGFRPVRSLRAGVGGSVDVQFAVNRQSDISRVTVVRSSGHDILDTEAAEHVRRLARIPQFPRDLSRDQVTLIATLRFTPERR